MKRKYLVNGTVIGGHYEILDVLGEDDFEILYLVKNIHRVGSFFVIKELFLETFSSRKLNSVETIPEAQGVFNKRKAEIIREIENAQGRYLDNEIKVFTYFEENNTIYSCMAYTPNANVESYLQFEPKEAKVLPTLEELKPTNIKNKKYFSLAFIAVVIMLLLGILFVAFNHYFNKESTSPIIKDNRTVIVSHNEHTVKLTRHILPKEDEAKKELWKNNFSLIKAPKELNKTVTEEENRTKVQEENRTKIQELNNTKVKEENRTEELPKFDVNELFTQKSLRQFLEHYIEVTAHGSSKKVVALYDSHVSRYFQFKNITPKKIEKSVGIYNKRWKNRDFKLIGFKMLKRYKKENIDYCDIETHTKWTVSNRSGKKIRGESKGIMTLISRNQDLKVKAIYAIK